MAADPCARVTLTPRAGLTQPARHLAERARDHFAVDDRDLADLVLFGQTFARQLRFYDQTNAEAGTWEAFFASDVTAALAALARLPEAPLARFQTDLDGWLRAVPPRGGAAALGVQLRVWFHLGPALLQAAGRALDRLPGDHPLALAAPVLMARDLARPLADLAGWFKGAIAEGQPGDADLFDDTAIVAADLNLTGAPADSRPRAAGPVADLLLGRPAFGALSFGARLSGGLAAGGWPALFAATPPDPAPYADAGTVAGRIQDALGYGLLTRAVDRLREGCLRLRADATAALAASLSGFAAHAPHAGLWLAFLQMFAHAQADMNAFTGRHMDFYLRDVLRLTPLAAVPDHAHLTFELARGTAAHLIPAGSAFGAGKDGAGRPVTFTLDSDLVVNRARVARVCAVRRQSMLVAGQWETRVTAAAEVRSADGFGAVPLAAGAAFAPFGPEPGAPARVGFAIADRRLFLREGARVITVTFPLRAPLAALPRAELTVRLTGEKGWHAAADVEFALVDDAAEEDDAPDTGHRRDRPKRAAAEGRRDARRLGEGDGVARRIAGFPVPKPRRPVQGLRLTVTLPPDAPAILPFDPALHGDEHEAGLPVLAVTFGFATAAGRRAFHALRDIAAGRPLVRATASGLTRLSVLAAGAEADPAKPFAPFGPRPRAGDALILGSSEVFSKPLASLSLTLDWLVPYSQAGFFLKAGAAEFTADQAVLEGGVWTPAQGPAPTLALHGRAGTIALTGAALVAGTVAQTVDNPVFDGGAKAGFLRLRLNRDFGHAQWPEEMTRASVSMAKGADYGKNGSYNYSGGSKDALPKAPYDPVLARITAAYATTTAPAEVFRHLWPFGVDAATGGRILPPIPWEAALFVGVEGFAGPARLTLLAEVRPGTGDPLLPRPVLSFAHLGAEGFIPLEDRDVDDKSLNLTTPGVIGLALPGNAAEEASPQMPGGLMWLRLSVNAHAAAVNDLSAMVAQAGRVTFADRGNDPARLALPLAAGSISRPLLPDPKVKVVAQPFAGFGGRPAEDAPAMDTRAAERLRHKDRAITPWDLEALVLQAFPQIYRAKCLPLTELVRDSAGVVVADHENRPGAVSLVAVPWVRPGAPGNPLRPYLDQATLQAVDGFLRPRLSPFARLEVTNPRIEEVHLDFRVRFAPGIADIAFYRDALDAALVAFLTPWAGAAGGEVSFGGRLWKSTVIDFLDSHPAVDFVTDVRMFHKPDVSLPEGGWTRIDTDLIETLSARSVLVSAARHTIAEVPR